MDQDIKNDITVHLYFKEDKEFHSYSINEQIRLFLKHFPDANDVLWEISW